MTTFAAWPLLAVGTAAAPDVLRKRTVQFAGTALGGEGNGYGALMGLPVAI
jgi:hypothetical protein